VRRHAIDATLRRLVPAARVVVAPGLTAGQACTVRLAAAELDLDDDVLVAACDATHLYDADRFESLRLSGRADALVWTYRGEFRVLAAPRSFGYARVNAAGDVEGVSCKTPISDRPLGDHVLSGFFWFCTGRLLMDAIDELVARDVRVNGEFYLDVVPNLLLAAGRSVAAFEVEKYIGWGTPEDYRDFERWERYFEQQRVRTAAQRQAG
jgi:hypothetical protein